MLGLFKSKHVTVAEELYERARCNALDINSMLNESTREMRNQVILVFDLLDNTLNKAPEPKKLYGLSSVHAAFTREATRGTVEHFKHISAGNEPRTVDIARAAFNLIGNAGMLLASSCMTRNARIRTLAEKARELICQIGYRINEQNCQDDADCELDEIPF